MAVTTAFFFWKNMKILKIITNTLSNSYKVRRAMERSGEDIFYEHARKWSRELLEISKVNVKVIGLEKLDPNESYIFASNHASLMDIPVLLASIPHNANIMYKHELEKVPYWGKTLGLSPFISVDRSSAVKAKKSLNNSVERLTQGQSLIIFPEGTRSLDGSIGEFKRGAFSAASVSKKEIVPVALKGTGALMEKGSKKLNEGNVEIHFLDPVSIASGDKKEVMSIIEDMRNKISKIVE